MNIIVSGASGLVGSALVPALSAEGHRVRRLVRGSPGRESGDVRWDPCGGILDPETLDGTDAVIHLAGENIASGRWTRRRKTAIRDSRVLGTRLLATALAQCARPPRVLVSASAVGYYGDRGEEQLTEESPPGRGFLADTCRQWEDAARGAEESGMRVVRLRIGMVLSSRGGALAKMLPAFRLGLGGRLGSGRQYMSWIDLEDLVRVMDRALCDDALRGPVNAVSPRPVTNREFTRSLGRVLRRPTLLRVPDHAARFVLGELARELLLSSQRVLPRRLVESGFEFVHPNLESALRHVLQ